MPTVPKSAKTPIQEAPNRGKQPENVQLCHPFGENIFTVRKGDYLSRKIMNADINSEACDYAIIKYVVTKIVRIANPQHIVSDVCLSLGSLHLLPEGS